MPPDLLPFRATPAPVAPPAPAAAPPADRPDVAVAALPLFARLRDALRLAGRVRDRRRALAARGWPAAPVFFFHPRAADPRPAPGPDPSLDRARRADPPAAAAWDRLPDLAADAVSVLADGPEARHAARAVPGLVAAARDLAADHPAARGVADLLAVADDEVVLVLDPAAGRGWRVVATGVADVAQFETLLADVVPLPNTRVSRRAAAAYRGRPGEPPAVVEAGFRLFGPRAVRPDGTLPPGLGGADHWLWGPEPLAAVPRVDGERVVLVGPPAFPRAWDAEPKFPRLPADVDVTETLSTAEVDGWVRGWCGAAPARAAARRAA